MCKRGEEEQPQKVPDLVRHCLCGRVLCEKAVSTRLVGARGDRGRGRGKWKELARLPPDGFRSREVLGE